MKRPRILVGAALALLLFFACASKDKDAFTESRWAASVEATQTSDLYAPHKTGNRFFAPWMSLISGHFDIPLA